MKTITKTKKVIIFLAILIIIGYIFYFILGYSMQIPKSHTIYHKFVDNLFEKHNIIMMDDSISISHRTKIVIFSNENMDTLAKDNLKKFSDSLFITYFHLKTPYPNYKKDTIIFNFKLKNIDTSFVYIVKNKIKK